MTEAVFRIANVFMKPAILRRFTVVLSRTPSRFCGFLWLARLLHRPLQGPSGPSVVTLKPAIRGHFKTGQRDWLET
jgi:hypothetical protein